MTVDRALWLRTTSAFSIALMGSSISAAQDVAPPPQASVGADDPAQEEIVVTATKTAQALQDVPISISAYRQERLDQLGVRSINDISALTPGVQIEAVRERASGANISIRGISSRIGANTTGIYIDDAPIQVRIIGYDASNVYPQVFDLERVEVLRGPQGTLYGAGSMGGNIRFITPRPNLMDLKIYARGELGITEGGGPNYEAGAAVNIPIAAGKLAARVSANYRRDGGWVDRANFQTGAITNRNSNWQNNLTLRGALAWEPVDGLRITPSIYYQKTQVNDASSYWSTLSDPDAGIYKNGYPGQNQTYNDRFTLPGLLVEKDFGSVLLSSSSSYFDRRAYNQWDYSTVVPAVLSRGALQTLPGYISTSYFVDKQKNYTEELRLQSSNNDDRLTFVVGLYYGHREQTSFQSVDAVGYGFLLNTFGLPASALPPLADGGKYGPSTLLITNSSVDEQFAAFGEVNLKLTPALTVTAGLRVEKSKLSFENLQSGPFNGPVSNGNSRLTAKPVTPKINISYKIDADNLIYANAAKGYRIGGGNAVLPPTVCASELARFGIAAAPTGYKPDSLWSYELGSKNEFFDRRLQVNSSAYYIKWKNIQQQIFPDCGFQYVDNVGGARSIGFDIQARARVTPEFTFGASVGYVRARYTSDAYPNNNTTLKPLVLDGTSLGIQPWTVVLTGDYERELSAQTSFYANLVMTYHSRDKGRTVFLEPRSVSFDPFRVGLDESTVVDARLGLRFTGIDVSIFAKNLLNSNALTSRNHDQIRTTLGKETRLRPRTVGMTATYRY